MNSHQLLSLFHVLVVGPFFLYVSLWPVPPTLFPFILGLGIVLAIYQTYKAFTKKDPAINIFHVAIVAPLLIYIGYEQPASTSFAYQLLLMLAFAVIGYHGYWLVHG
jgi:hypothetical protein